MISLPEGLQIRLATDSDSKAAIELIKRSYEEYREQGVIFDLEEESDLITLESSFALRDGVVFAVTKNTVPKTLVGIGGFIPFSQNVIELKKLYVDQDFRGTGIGQYLVEYIISQARSLNARELVLWTDTRFTKAHRLYEKMGFVKGPTARKLADKSNTEEYSYRLVLMP